MTRRWHTPRLFAWLLLAAGLAVFTTLGRWQWGRAQEKEQLLAAYAAAERAPPEALAAVADAALGERLPRVGVRGRFVAERGYLIDEQPRDGRVGVLVLALFEPDGTARKLLVNRGWLPWSHAPGSQPTVPPLPRGEVELLGLYAPPPGGGLRIGGNALERQTRWPKLTLYVDLPQMAADLGATLYPRLLLQDADPASGFVRAWTPAVMPPARHRAYAVQWWSFAVVALVIFIVLHWRKPAPPESP